MKKTLWIVGIGMFTLSSCTLPSGKIDQPHVITTTNDLAQENKADRIVSRAIQAHGGDLYDQAGYAFTFRKSGYSFTNDQDGYTYTRTYEIDEMDVVDRVTNGEFTRTANGAIQRVSQKEADKLTSSISSVIYFATLPHKLKDAAVNKVYKGQKSIKGKTYDVIEVTFDEEGGGVDHEDEYYYWFEQRTGRMDYFAYNYRVNGGGVRFRSAYDPRAVSGILFQNYVNYKASKGTPLADLPTLFEQGGLKELSRIETTNVIKLKNGIK